MALTKGVLYNYNNVAGTKVSGHYREGGLSSGVAFKRGSTVLLFNHGIKYVYNCYREVAVYKVQFESVINSCYSKSKNNLVNGVLVDSFC